jgi:hypothetical protein
MNSLILDLNNVKLVDKELSFFQKKTIEIEINFELKIK